MVPGTIVFIVKSQRKKRQPVDGTVKFNVAREISRCNELLARSNVALATARTYLYSERGAHTRAKRSARRNER